MIKDISLRMHISHHSTVDQWVTLWPHSNKVADVGQQHQELKDSGRKEQI